MDSLPRQLTYRGSRLVYSRGIVSIGVGSFCTNRYNTGECNQINSAVCNWRFPVLYSVTSWDGASLVESQANSNQVRKQWSEGRHSKNDKAWVFKMIVNGLGSFVTAIVMMVFAFTKFKDGAWFVVIPNPHIDYRI